jgi:hypothetical protein
MTTLPDNVKIACCLSCALATSMRDCNQCPFQVGLSCHGQIQGGELTLQLLRTFFKALHPDTMLIKATKKEI